MAENCPPMAPAAPPCDLPVVVRAPATTSVRTKITPVDDRRQVLGDVVRVDVTACWYCGDIASANDRRGWHVYSGWH